MPFLAKTKHVPLESDADATPLRPEPVDHIEVGEVVGIFGLTE